MPNMILSSQIAQGGSMKWEKRSGMLIFVLEEIAFNTVSSWKQACEKQVHTKMWQQLTLSWALT